MLIQSVPYNRNQQDKHTRKPGLKPISVNFEEPVMRGIVSHDRSARDGSGDPQGLRRVVFEDVIVRMQPAPHHLLRILSAK